MSFSIGGAQIVDMEFTRSWGLSPASGKISALGDASISAGDDAVLSIGGASFYGVVSDIRSQTEDGTRMQISFVDNRIKLMWDDVYGLFNRVDVRPDNPATPGIDRQKRYAHILPGNWDQQIKTYTDTPYSAQEIINFCLNAPTV